MNTSRDSYLMIDVTWKGGFKHSVPCRGYNLKSQIKFQESLHYIDSFVPRIVTQKEYDAFVFGESECQSSQPAGTKSKTSTKRSSAQPKPGKSAKTVGSKRSTTKVSVKRVTKNTKSNEVSSTPSKKKSTGSRKQNDK